MAIGASFHMKVVRGDIKFAAGEALFSNQRYFLFWVVFGSPHFSLGRAASILFGTLPPILKTYLWVCSKFTFFFEWIQTFIIPYVAMEIFIFSRLNEDRFSIAQTRA